MIHYIDARHAVFTCGPVTVRIIDSALTTNEDLELLFSLTDDILERSPLAGIWVIIHHGAPFPEATVRRQMSQSIKRYGDRLCLVYSMLGLGFWANAAQRITVALTKAMGNSVPIETTVEGGSQRLCMDMIGVDPEKLVEAYEEVLRQMTAMSSVA